MKVRVETMRSNAEKVKDPNTKAALLDNADMWDQFMNQMQTHMSMMMKGGMQHGGMTHGKKSPANTSSQTSTPKPQ